MISHLQGVKGKRSTRKMVGFSQWSFVELKSVKTLMLFVSLKQKYSCRCGLFLQSKNPVFALNHRRNQLSDESINKFL